MKAGSLPAGFLIGPDVWTNKPFAGFVFELFLNRLPVPGVRARALVYVLVLYETMMERSVFFCGNEVALKTFLFVYLRFMC